MSERTQPVGEGGRERSPFAVAEGAASTAPTAPHATPSDDPAAQQTGPARFWSKRQVRRGMVLGIVLSAVFHYLISPFSVMPDGPPIDLHDQEGELSIPVEILEDTPQKAETPAPTATGTTSSVVKGPGDAGIDREVPDAQPDVVANAVLDAGAPRDAAPEDAAVDAEEADGAAVALGGDGGAGTVAGRDPRAILGVVGAVSSDPANVTVAINFQVIRKHPEAARLAPILGAIPQWRQFMSASGGTALLDPLHDADWMTIWGPSLLHTERDAVYVQYSAPDAVVDGVIAKVAKGYEKGGPINLHVRGVKAWRAYADRAERVFIRPRSHVAMIVPSSHAAAFARAIAAHPVNAHFRPGEALSFRALRPGGSTNLIPSSISELRMWIVPRNADSGADLYIEGDCPDAASAQQAAESLKNTLRQKNSFGVRMLTAGLLNNVEFSSDGAMVKGHLSASKDQIDAILGLAAGQVGATLPPPAPAASH